MVLLLQGVIDFVKKEYFLCTRSLVRQGNWVVWLLKVC